jgi:hypothetical protein
VTIDRVSFDGGICSGTTVLSCCLGGRGAGARDDIDIRVRINRVGTFTSNIVARISNDTNPANDQVTLQIQGTAATSPPAAPPAAPPSSSGGGGKGGGGRFEWFALALLALMVARPILARALDSRRARRAVHRRLSTPRYVARN